MKKISFATSIALLLTAAMLIALFACILGISSFQKGDEGNSSDQSSSEVIGNVIGGTLLLMIGIPLSFSYPLCAALFVAFAIALLVAKPDAKFAKGFTALVVLTAILVAFVALGSILLCAAYKIFAPQLIAPTCVMLALYATAFALEIAYKKQLHKALQQNTNSPIDQQ